MHSELEIVLGGKSTEEGKSGNQESTNTAVEQSCSVSAGSRRYREAMDPVGCLTVIAAKGPMTIFLTVLTTLCQKSTL